MRELAAWALLILGLAFTAWLRLRPSPTQSGEAGIQWIRIPGGAFAMGSKAEDEGPVHRVTIRTFQMAKTLVTNKQYRECVRAGACTKPFDFGARFEGDALPVVGVDWSQASSFSRWAGGRLPTEAEWEYAARGAGNAFAFPWGDEDFTCDNAVARRCSRATMPVCSKPQGNTVQGLCDMAGNAWEWVQDLYHDSYRGAPSDGAAWEVGASTLRIIRGGSWWSDSLPLSTLRESRAPTDQPYDVGFRPARSL